MVPEYIIEEYLAITGERRELVVGVISEEEMTATIDTHYAMQVKGDGLVAAHWGPGGEW